MVVFREESTNKMRESANYDENRQLFNAQRTLSASFSAKVRKRESAKIAEDQITDFRGNDMDPITCDKSEEGSCPGGGKATTPVMTFREGCCKRNM